MLITLLTAAIFLADNAIKITSCQTHGNFAYSETKIGLIYSSTLQCFDDELSAVKKSWVSEQEFRLPVFDTIIHNNRSLILMQEPTKRWFFMLHGRELHQLFVSRHQTSFSLVGFLDDDMWKTEHLAAEIRSWHDYLLLAIAFDETLLIYEIEEELISNESGATSSPANGTVPKFHIIQQIAMAGTYRDMFLVWLDEDQLFLFLAVDSDYSNLDTHVKTFEWMDTYFHYVDDLQIPRIDVITQQNNYIITGQIIKDLSKTVITTYGLKTHPSMKLERLQTLTVDSEKVQFVNLQGKHYLIACSASDSDNCKMYKMKDGQSSVFKELPSQRLAFSQLIVGRSFVVGKRGNQILVMPSDLSCYSSFTLNDTDVSTIMILTNAHGEDFLMLSYSRADKSILRIVDFEALQKRIPHASDSDDDIVLQDQNHHIIEYVVGRLRSILLQHNAATVLFRKLALLKRLHLQHAVTITSGKILSVRLVDPNLQSPAQLLQRATNSKKYIDRYQRPRRALNTPPNNTESAPVLLKASRLRVDNLIFNGSLLEDFQLDAAAKPLPILSIHRPLQTKLLNTPVLLTPLPMQTFNAETERNVSLRRVNVQSINNLMWSEFYDSLFLKNRDKGIEGRLVMQAATTMHNLKTTRLNGLIVENLFNLVLPQVIHSDILISSVRVSDLNAELVNGLDFAKDIVFHGAKDVINSHVILRRMSISDASFLENNSKQKRANWHRHLYTGKVLINGTLTVNLNLLAEAAKQVQVDGQSFSTQDLNQNYLLVKTEQAFVEPVKIAYGRVEAPTLKTAYLNGHPTQQHLLNNEKEQINSRPLFLIFMAAKVNSKVINIEHRSRLANISSNAVRHGEVANITGKKIFHSALSVNNLTATVLNDVFLGDLVLKSQLPNNNRLHMGDPKYFDQIKVRNITNVEFELNATHLNSLSLNELLSLDYHLDKLIVPHDFIATNVVFNKLNGISFDEVFTNLTVRRDEVLVLRKKLIIEGDAEFSGELFVDSINNVDWNEYKSSLVRLNEHVLVHGQKRFLKEVLITEDINAVMWNNLNLTDILANVLYKTRPQVIKGSYYFDDLSVGNMDVTVINDVPTAAFIDTNTAELIIEGDIVVPAVNVVGNVTGGIECGLDWSTIAPRLQQLPTKPWRNLNVLGDARWTEQSWGVVDRHAHSLAYLQRNAVTNKGDQVINGNVRIWRPLISTMTTTSAFPKTVDFAYIAKDGLFRNITAEQTISAPKSFVKPLHVLKVEAAADVTCKLFNNIDVVAFNASLYRVSSGEPIHGPVHFTQPPLVGNLTVHGAINEVRCEQIYNGANTLLPPLTMTNLHADLLRLEDINDMSLEYLLQNRITKNGAALEVFGFLTFDHLVLNKEILLQSINNIPINSLVLKNSHSLQSITGAKIIEGDLILAGPAHVMHLNNQNLVNCYQSSIFTNLNYHFDHLAVDKATFEHSLQLITDDEILAAAPNATASERRLPGKEKREDKPSARLQVVADNVQDMRKWLSSNRKPKHLLYLYHDVGTEVVWSEETIDRIAKTHMIEVQRLSPCSRQILRVQVSANGQRLFLHNMTTDGVLTAERGGWAAKAENYCNVTHTGLSSRVTISSSRSNFSKVIDFEKFTQHIEFFSPNNDDSAYLLLHFVDAAGSRCEVRLIRLDNHQAVVNVQTITQGIGRILSFFQPSRNHSLLVSTAVSRNQQAAVSIYVRVADTQLFDLVQVISGNYDLFECVQISDGRYHLILSCVKCRSIKVLEFNAAHQGLSPTPASDAFSIFQSILLKHFVQRLLLISFGDGGMRYLLVLSSNGQDHCEYHMYKFSSIQGWLPFTHGYYENVQMVLPLLDEGDSMDPHNVRLLFCGNSRCSLTKAHLQLGMTPYI